MKKYLCESSDLQINRVNFVEKMGLNDPMVVSLECKVIVYMERGMLMVALHHHFPLEA